MKRNGTHVFMMIRISLPMHTSHGFHQRRLKQPIDFIITMEITFNRINPSPGLPLRKTLSRFPTSSIKTIFSSLTLRMNNESTYYNGPSTSTNCTQNGPTKVNAQSTTRDWTLNLDGFIHSSTDENNKHIEITCGRLSPLVQH